MNNLKLFKQVAFLLFKIPKLFKSIKNETLSCPPLLCPTCSPWRWSEVPVCHGSFQRYTVHKQQAGITPLSLPPSFVVEISAPHTHFAFCTLIFFTCYVMEIVPYQYMQHFHVLFHGYPIFLSIDVLLLIYQSPTDTYLCCFQSFPIANNVALNYLFVCHFKHMLVRLSDEFLKGWISGSKSMCICNFESYCQINFINVVPIYTPTSNVWNCLFPHRLANNKYCCIIGVWDWKMNIMI